MDIGKLIGFGAIGLGIYLLFSKKSNDEQQIAMGGGSGIGLNNIPDLVDNILRDKDNSFETTQTQNTLQTQQTNKINKKTMQVPFKIGTLQGNTKLLPGVALMDSEPYNPLAYTLLSDKGSLIQAYGLYNQATGKLESINPAISRGITYGASRISFSHNGKKVPTIAYRTKEGKIAYAPSSNFDAVVQKTQHIKKNRNEFLQSKEVQAFREYSKKHHIDTYHVLKNNPVYQAYKKRLGD